MTREEFDNLLNGNAEKTPLTPKRFVALLSEMHIAFEKESAGPVNHWSENCSKCKSGEHYLDVTEQEIKEIQNVANFVEERNKK